MKKIDTKSVMGGEDTPAMLPHRMIVCPILDLRKKTLAQARIAYWIAWQRACALERYIEPADDWKTLAVCYLPPSVKASALDRKLCKLDWESSWPKKPPRHADS